MIRKQNLFLIISYGVILAISTAGCLTSAFVSPAPDDTPQSQISEEKEAPAKQESGPEEGEGEATSKPDEPAKDPQLIAQQEWESGPYVNTFVLDDQGQNNTCARCHSPANWMPSMDDIPESCQSCKFEVEPPDPTIPQEEWSDIPCQVCHQEDKKGNIQPEIAWLEVPALEEYASVDDATELCLKCHDTQNVPEHGTVNVAGVMADFQCTKCHNAHSTAASCDAEGCHQDILTPPEPIPGHDQDHKEVACVACHDGAGLEVRPNEELGYWITYLPWLVETEVGDSETKTASGTVPFTSHNISLEVNCQRCHFADNPWDLTVEIDSP
jgi:hypothetical protein